MPVQPPSLIVVTGPSLGRVVFLDTAISIGRDASNDVAINDSALSRHHCQFERGPDQTLLTDLDSRNGTLVNGVPIRSRPLVDGDQIRIGDSVLLFVAVSAASEAPSPASMPGSTAPGALIVDEGPMTRMQFSSDRAIEHDLIGESDSMREVYTRIGRVAPSESTVLIQGESGTGKELIARAIHANSRRSAGPFVAINCAAVPEGLMESELFGHERGAFTGALAQKRGRIETANGGTVFLDEVSELSMALQAKLLRVIQERQVDRVGGHRPIPIEVRILAATNTDLARAVKEGKFRSDLFYRLNVIAISVPPLRARNGDVPLLITYFLRHYAGQCKRRVRGVTREARSILARYEWPGNVRELENAIERAVVMSTGEWVDVGDLPEHILESPPNAAADGYHALVAHAKRDAIRKALASADGNVARAARQLKLPRAYLHRLMTNLGLRDESAADGRRDS
jgi:transcriptional regulator with PAS, ATPase and Fis domain